MLDRKMLLSFLALGICVITGSGCSVDSKPKDPSSLEIVDVSFAERQQLAQPQTLAITLSNNGLRVINQVAATITTESRASGTGALAFSRRINNPALADDGRPVWLLQQDPSGDSPELQTTWTFGPIAAGATKTFRWQVVPVIAGKFTLRYRISVDNKDAAVSSVTDTLPVSISATPQAVSVNDSGEVVSN